MKIKNSSVAGTFYPVQQSELRDTALDLLENNPSNGPKPKAIIVPHAGYIYSGAIAALAYNRIRPHLHTYKRIIILGPAHRESIDFMASLTAQIWRTPLGDINLDVDYTNSLVNKGFVQYFDKAHQQEHSLEVQLPLLQSIDIKEIPVVPIVIGHVGLTKSVQLIKYLLENDQNLIVISTDLSHFQPYSQAIKTDSKTVNQIMAFATNISAKQACGCYPLNALLRCAAHFSLSIEFLGYCNSGDYAGKKDAVVGYSAFALTSVKPIQELTMNFTLTQKKQMLAIARQCIENGLSDRASFDQHLSAGQLTDEYLQQEQPCFVSLKVPVDVDSQSLQLRGCIGNLQPRGTLLQSICRNAKLAAFEDSRFPPLAQQELNNLVIEISILSQSKRIFVDSEAQLLEVLKPNVDGLIIRYQQQQATFLPSVWEQLPLAKQFLRQLKRKAGMAEDFWSSEMQCYIYHSVNFSNA